MNSSRVNVRCIALLIGLVVLALLAGCSKQESTAPKTETAAQQPAPQAAPQAAQPAAPAAEPAPSRRPTERKPSALSSKPAPQAPQQGQRAGSQPLALPSASAPPAPPAPVKYTIAADTPIEVRLQDPVSSADSPSGQQFAAVLAAPIVVDGQTLARRGANAWGTVVKATPSGRLQTPAELIVRLDAIEIRGRRVAVATETVGQKADSHNKRNAIGIGGGAALGAIIGGIAGGGKGAAIGAGAGAGAGTAGAAATGKKDITYPVETPLTFRLTKSVTVE